MFLALKMVDLMVTNLSVLTSVLVSTVRVCVVVPAFTAATLTGMLAAGLDAVAVGEATGVGVPLPAAGVVVARQTRDGRADMHVTLLQRAVL